MLEKEKAVEIIIFVHTDVVGHRGDVLKRAKQALKCNSALKLCVCFGQARRPGCRRQYSRCLRIKIPRRRFKQAREDGRLEKLLTHRVFRRSELHIMYPKEIQDIRSEILARKFTQKRRRVA